MSGDKSDLLRCTERGTERGPTWNLSLELARASNGLSVSIPSRAYTCRLQHSDHGYVSITSMLIASVVLSALIGIVILVATPEPA